MRITSLAKTAGPWTVDIYSNQIRMKHTDDRVELGKVFNPPEIRDLQYVLDQILRHHDAEEEANRRDR